MRMSIASRVSRRRNQRGQILPLTVIMLVVLIGITGLAIDVSSALSTQRFERAVADAASLAGAQDLQIAGSRTLPGPTEKSNARSHAMQVLVAQLGASSPPSTACTTESATGCLVGSACLMAAGCPLPGTPYNVSIRTPSPSCVDCADSPDLAVQVTITNPSFGLTFSRILGASRWSVSAASVAATVHARFFGVVTLRPPRPRTQGSGNADLNEKDITLNGGSTVHVISGDVGTNTNLYVPNNATMTLDPGYKVYHNDGYEAWTEPPPGFQISTLIKDPKYSIPTRTASTPIYTTPAQGKDTATNCTAEQAKVPATYTIKDGTAIRTLPSSQVSCFKPGIYSFNGPSGLNNNDKAQAFLLEPGVYFMDGGLQSSSTVVGGYEGGQPGVALVFNECHNQCDLKANSSDLWALNFGDAAPFGSGSRATAAVGPQGLVQTSAVDHVLMTLMVVPDLNCVVKPPPYPSSCNDSTNDTIKLGGAGAIYIAGVQYAPSDNVTTSGNTNGNGIMGAIYAWTLTYDSGNLNEESAAGKDAGPLRLDRACSPGGTVCIP
jgi:Flp pilus assembly protein TadG